MEEKRMWFCPSPNTIEAKISRAEMREEEKASHTLHSTVYVHVIHTVDV
jgi:hypothetical protein